MKHLEERVWEMSLIPTHQTFTAVKKGEMTDGINKGLPSDHFEVHWHLKGQHLIEDEPLDVSGAVLNTLRNNGKSFSRAGLASENT